MQAPSTQAISDLHHRRSTASFWGAVAGAVICIAVIVTLIVTWPDHGGGSTSASDVAPAPTKQTSSTAAARSVDARP